jgi:hypothetical protein
VCVTVCACVFVCHGVCVAGTAYPGTCRCLSLTWSDVDRSLAGFFPMTPLHAACSRPFTYLAGQICGLCCLHGGRRKLRTVRSIILQHNLSLLDIYQALTWYIPSIYQEHIHICQQYTWFKTGIWQVNDNFMGSMWTRKVRCERKEAWNGILGDI